MLNFGKDSKKWHVGPQPLTLLFRGTSAGEKNLFQVQSHCSPDLRGPQGVRLYCLWYTCCLFFIFRSLEEPRSFHLRRAEESLHHLPLYMLHRLLENVFSLSCNSNHFFPTLNNKDTRYWEPLVHCFLKYSSGFKLYESLHLLTKILTNKHKNRQ